MDFVTPLQRILQSQATLEQTRATTEDTSALAKQRMLGVLMNQRAFQQQLEASEALKSGKFDNPASTPGGAGPNPLAQYDYDSPLIDSAKSAMEGVNVNRQRMAIARGAGLTDMWSKASADMDNQQKELGLAMKAVMTDDLRRTTEAAQAFQTADTPEKVKASLDYVAESLGPKKAQAIGQQLARALPGGIDNATPEQIQAAKQPILDMITKRGVQLRNEASIRSDAAREKELQRKKDEDQARAARAQAGAEPPKQADVEAVGAQVATGVPLSQAVPGYGKWVQPLREAARTEAIKQIKDEEGVTSDADAGRILAQRGIDYLAGRRSTTQLNTMRGATSQAVKQLDYNVDKVTEEMKKLPSTDISPVLNALVRGAERWTGAPEYSSLYFYMHAAAMESARILQGGQASIAQLHQGAAEEAKKWADIGITPSMWGEVSKAMHDEGVARLATYDAAMKEQRVGKARDDTGPSKAAPAATAPTQTYQGKSYRYVGPMPMTETERTKRENWKVGG